MKKAMFKIGDRVKVRKNLTEDDDGPSGVGVVESMLKYRGEILTITNIEERADGVYYNVKEDKNRWNWDETWFYKQKYNETKPIVEESESTKDDEILQAFKNINKNIEALSKGFDKKTLYEESMRDKMMEKIKEESCKGIESEIKTKIDEYIKNTYKVLPKVIEIQKETQRKEIAGLFHKKFEEILKIVDKGVPLMLTGPAGAGKNHTLEQVAKALDLPFYFTNAVTQEYKLTGFIDASGTYQETQFYKAWTNGGLFFLDEIDASVAEALIILNSAIANGYFDFPIGRVDVNPRFRVVCAGNTFGTGADMIYVGRNQLDGATLDRFAVIEFDYDDEIEKQLAYDSELYDFVKELRRVIREASLRYIISMRATINATKLLEIGIPKQDIITSVIIKNMQVDDLNVIVKKINKSSEWGKLLEKIAEDRSKIKV